MEEGEGRERKKGEGGEGRGRGGEGGGEGGRWRGKGGREEEEMSMPSRCRLTSVGAYVHTYVLTHLNRVLYLHGRGKHWEDE